jgi:endonuclease III
MSQATKQQRLEMRNERIRKRFNALTSAPKHHSTDYALKILADEYLELTENTIWLIITETGFYSKKKKQNETSNPILTLFSTTTGTNQL